MERVYISGPITDNPTFREDFARAEKYLKEEGYCPINPAEATRQIAESGSEYSHDEYMEICIPFVRMASKIYLLKGWENSRGAKKELSVALHRGMDVLVEK